MASSASQIDTPQRGRPKRTELPDVNINTGAQSINTECFFKTVPLMSNPSPRPDEGVKIQYDAQTGEDHQLPRLPLIQPN